MKCARFFLQAIAAGILAATVTGCSSGDVATSSTGSGGAATSSSSGGPTVPESAWTVSMSGSGICGSDSLGKVTDSQESALVPSGMYGQVTCSVTGSASSYSVSGTAVYPGILSITIPSITASATKQSPAAGKVVYQPRFLSSNQFSGTCSFYFLPGTSETVAPGKIWAAFTCPALTSTTGVTCAAAESYVAFDGCM